MLPITVASHQVVPFNSGVRVLGACDPQIKAAASTAGIVVASSVLAGAAPAGARPLMGVSRILGGPDDVIWEQESGVGFDIVWFG